MTKYSARSPLLVSLKIMAIAKHDPTETINVIAKNLREVKIQVIDEVYQIEQIEFS
jgi:hypothetical protein